jgi:uncharacterized protein
LDIPRYLQLTEIIRDKSAFLFGPRSTGKSYLIKKQFPDGHVINLLMAKDRRRYVENPSMLHDFVKRIDVNQPVIIDEIQMVPELLDEVHSIIEETGHRFLLTGSSARKLKRSNANMLGGRAKRCDFFPLTWKELSSVNQFNLGNFLLYGGIPRVYLGQNPADELSDYVDTYLDQEIKAEAVSRNIIGFERFLQKISFASGETLVYANIASDIQLSSPTVRQYVEVLEDTLLSFSLTPWQGSKRKAIQSSRFFLFDIGLRWFLSQVSSLPEASNLYGQAFEQFIVQEVRACYSYRRIKKQLYFWRTTHNEEVDLIIGDEIAIEVKASKKVSDRDSSGLIKLKDEGFKGKLFVVSRDEICRTKSGIEYLYWEEFLNQIWK